jgi:hypothetical protein
VRPDPVVELDCSAEDDLNICLEWTTYETSADSFCIFMATDGQCDTAVWVGTVDFTDTGVTYEWCTDDAGLELIQWRWYDFIVYTYDSCGNRQEQDAICNNDESFVTRCLADLAPPVVCVFQPATLSPEEDTTLYSCDRCDLLPNGFLDPGDPDGMWIYVRPCNDTSIDVQYIDSVLIRLADSAGTPGEWHYAGFSSYHGPNHWAIRIDCESLDLLAREDDSVEVIQVMVISTDGADRMSTREQVEDCCGFFEFKWSAYYVEVAIETINDKVQTWQPYCNVHGWEVWGPDNTVEVCIEGGTPPYKIKIETRTDDNDIDHEFIWVENVYAQCTTFTFSAVGWVKGYGEIEVDVCDAAGHDAARAAEPQGHRRQGEPRVPGRQRLLPGRPGRAAVRPPFRPG